LSFLITASLAVLISLVVMSLELLELWFARLKRKHPNRVGTNRTLLKTSFWLKVYKKILLGLSDTQLLTGLGMQAAVWIDHCSISIYHYIIAVELAHMSTVTHLLTMVALKSYFDEHRFSTLPRILLMILNLGLFCYENFVGNGLSNVVEPGYDFGGNNPLACYYQHPRPSLKNSQFRGDWITAIVLSIASYVIVLWQVFKPRSKRRDDSPRPWWRKWLVPVPMIIAICFAWAYMILGFVGAASTLHDTQALGGDQVMLANLGYTINGSEKEWEFGQLLPMFLVALPFLGGWELGCEVHADEEKDRKDTEISKTISEILVQQSSEQEIKPTWSNHGINAVDYRA
jgi:hypothetical protein